jgi:O-antigen/teichoic acid export membrane protein
MSDTENIGPVRFEIRAFGKDMLVYAAGNGLVLIFGFLQSLIIPKFLPTAGYGYWQLFNLYFTYIGILHFGFLDGLLVHWAGRELDQLKGDIRPAFTFLLIEQLAVVLPLAAIIYCVTQPPYQFILLMVCVYALIWNLATFFIFITQSARKFRLLTALTTVRGFIFLVLIFLLFISGILDYELVIIAALLSYFIFTVVIIFHYRKYLWNNKSGSESHPMSYGKKYISTGIFVLAGNFIVFVFWSLDRLLVSNSFTIEQFALYAFAMSVVNIILTFIRAIADVLFPHLAAIARSEQAKMYSISKTILMFAWAILLCVYFPLAALIAFYLPNYIASLGIIKIMFGVLGFSSLILINHVNYFRLNLKQRRYFIVGAANLAIAIALVIAAIRIFGTLESVAVAILISAAIWYIINEFSLRSMTGEKPGGIWKDFAATLCFIAGFMISSMFNYWIILQMLIYIGFFLVVSLAFFRPEVFNFIGFIQKHVSRSSK